MGMDDGLASSLLGSAYFVINENSINSETIDRFDIVQGIINLPKYIGVSLLPICFIFVPYSIISLLRKENKNFRYLVLMGIFALIPALYAYSRGFEETRYVFVVLPILIIASLFLIEKIILRFGKQNMVAGGLIALIMVSSIIYLDFREPDYEYEKESVEVARFVSNLPGTINGYGPETYYVEVMDLEDKKFPILSSEINFQKKVIRLQGEAINEIIQDAKDKGLSYLAVTSAGQNDNQILSKIYHEEYNYPYLKKIYDSKDYSFKFNVKIFEINYNEFELVR
jgi:4-amino-4-deoxy-L-arabinose transferase-like glycosyltransferase